MTIRPAQAGDYSQIYSLVQTAFATAKVSDGTEQDFVLELRRRDTYRPELELVAEENGQLIGHILLTILPVPGAPQGLRGLMVAPLCVRLEDRSRGLGGQLLQEGGAGRRSWGTTPCFWWATRTTTAGTASRTPSPWGSKTPPACPTSFCWHWG